MRAISGTRGSSGTCPGTRTGRRSSPPLGTSRCSDGMGWKHLSRRMRLKVARRRKRRGGKTERTRKRKGSVGRLLEIGNEGGENLNMLQQTNKISDWNWENEIYKKSERVMPFFYMDQRQPLPLAFQMLLWKHKQNNDLIKSALFMYKYRYLVQLAFVVVIFTP